MLFGYFGMLGEHKRTTSRKKKKKRLIEKCMNKQRRKKVTNKSGEQQFQLGFNSRTSRE